MHLYNQTRLMRKSVARIRGLGFILWQARHNFYHILLGLVWAWFIREWFHELNAKWIFLAVFGSLLPDIDHVVYFLSYGKNDWYTVEIKKLLKSKEWRMLTMFMANGHKQNTNLASHNIYFMGLLLIFAILSFFFEWQSAVILFGAMIIHYGFDILDDVLLLGALNPNWKRWGREKKRF